MLLHNFWLGWKSLRRTPILSGLTMLAIALGIATSTMLLTVFYLMSGGELPDNADDLYYVRLDQWNPDRPWDDEHPERPPNQLTFRDMTTLLESDIPLRQTGGYKAELFVHPDQSDELPFATMARLCTREFFAMFQVPFLFGGPWSAEQAASGEPMIVIDDATNQKLFGGENSVGKSIKVDQARFTIAGVLAPWRPALKFYDVHNGAQQRPEQLFFPIDLGQPMVIGNSGNTSGWTGYEGGLKGKFESESIWTQLWVELDNPEKVSTYKAFLDNYTNEQRKAGRHPRPNNNWVQPMREHHREEEAVSGQTRSLTVIGLLFLIVCSVNLIGLLLGKFLARAPEVGIRRALGASRSAIFWQHIAETQLIALIGGGIGIGIAGSFLAIMSRISDNQAVFALNWTMVGAGILLSIFAGLIAGFYPAWRICSVAPASHLKLQ